MELLHIPKNASMAGWKQLPIQPTTEPLIRIPDDRENGLISFNEYYRQRLPETHKDLYVRQMVLTRLHKAVKLLKEFNPKLCLIIYDSFRSIETQTDLFNKYTAQLTETHPQWDKFQLEIEAQKYVSIPSLDPNKPSPHNTGGAIDLVIADQSLTKIAMGSSGVDDWSRISRSDYFEKAITPKEIIFRDNRRLLYTIMILAGFTNYPEEWWHFDYGNQFWAKVTGQPAIYGPIEIKP